MHIAVIGAGSIGLLIAGKTAASGCHVTVFTRTNGARDVLRESGITVSGLTNLMNIPVKAEILEQTERDAAILEADWVIVTVKQTHLTDVFLQQLAASFRETTRFLFIQNGIGHCERFAKYTDEERIYAAVTTEGARKISGLEVTHTGAGETWFGHFGDNSQSSFGSCAQKQLIDGFERAGFRAFMSVDMKNKVWDKLLINAVINPLTAIMRIPNGDLLLSQERMRLMRRLYEEGVRAALLIGVTASPDLWERIQTVCRLTAANYSSMLQDVLAGRPTEIDAITGSLIRTAQPFGVELNTHQTMLELILCMEPVIQTEQ